MVLISVSELCSLITNFFSKISNGKLQRKIIIMIFHNYETKKIFFAS